VEGEAECEIKVCKEWEGGKLHKTLLISSWVRDRGYPRKGPGHGKGRFCQRRRVIGS
jgi:hypothetical protein